MKNVLKILVALLILGGGYVAYRYFTADQELGKSFNGDEARATVCEHQGGGTIGSGLLNLSIHVKGRFMRVDWEQYQEGWYAHFHLISNGEEVYIWTDEKAEGAIASASMFFKENPDLETEFYRSEFCRPWWLPDMSLFSVPSDVDFQTWKTIRVI